jgi:hypothetical protein
MGYECASSLRIDTVKMLNFEVYNFVSLKELNDELIRYINQHYNTDTLDFKLITSALQYITLCTTNTAKYRFDILMQKMDWISDPRIKDEIITHLRYISLLLQSDSR